jgi:hypothetical protein
MGRWSTQTNLATFIMGNLKMGKKRVQGKSFLSMGRLTKVGTPKTAGMAKAFIQAQMVLGISVNSETTVSMGVANSLMRTFRFLKIH